jgi:hypothetical protein
MEAGSEPLNVIVLLPCVDPNPLPVTVTCVPTGPDVGETALTTFLGTVWFPALLATLFTYT